MFNPCPVADVITSRLSFRVRRKGRPSRLQIFLAKSLLITEIDAPVSTSAGEEIVRLREPKSKMVYGRFTSPRSSLKRGRRQGGVGAGLPSWPRMSCSLGNRAPSVPFPRNNGKYPVQGDHDACSGGR